MTTNSLSTIPDRALLEAVMRAAGDERRATIELIALLGEVEARRLYLSEGCPTLFTYCTRVLRLSEHEAYLRLEVSRTARRFPIILERLSAGELTLTTVAMLGPRLNDDNADVLLAAAAHKTKREVEHQIACLAPKPDAKSLIRRLPASPAAERGESGESALLLVAAVNPMAGDASAAGPAAEVTRPTVSAPRPQLKPLSADRYLLRVTLSADAYAKLRRAQDLMRHRIPNGDPALVVQHALALLVDQLEKRKGAQSTKYRSARSAMAAEAMVPNARSTTARKPSTRYIPANVRRDVWERDEGRCGFIGRHGRCAETSQLEFHHIEPFARGVPATAANLALRCRAHNQFESEQLFGPWEGP